MQFSNFLVSRRLEHDQNMKNDKALAVDDKSQNQATLYAMFPNSPIFSIQILEEDRERYKGLHGPQNINSCILDLQIKRSAS